MHSCILYLHIHRVADLKKDHGQQDHDNILLHFGQSVEHFIWSMPYHTLQLQDPCCSQQAIYLGQGMISRQNDKSATSHLRPLCSNHTQQAQWVLVAASSKWMQGTGLYLSLTLLPISMVSEQTCAAIALTVGLQVVLDQGYPDTMHTHVYNLFIFALLN